MTVPALVVEVAFAADPLATVDAYIDCSGASGSYIYTPDATALDIVGDIDVCARVALDDWTPAADSAIAGKWVTLGNQRSWRLYVTTAGLLVLQTTADGSTLLTHTSTVAPSFTNGTSYWVRATIDVNNGAGGRTVTFYTAADSRDEPTSWSTLGSAVTVAATTSIFSGNANLEAGAVNNGTLQMMAGLVRRVILRNGIEGTVVADLDAYDMHTTSATTFGSSRVPAQIWTRTASTTATITPTWSDITSRVRNQQVTISRGKQNELQTFGTSSMSMVLDNRDRAFDPDYSSSPYFPNVKPARRVRVRAEYASTRYDLWNGYIEEWPQQYAAGNVDATVPVQAFDIMALAGETELRDAALAYVQSSTTLLAGAFRAMVDGDWYDEIGQNYVRKRAGLTQTDTQMPAVGTGTPVLLNGSTFYSTGTIDERYSLPVFSGLTTNQGYWSCWFKTTGTGPSATNWSLIMGSGPATSSSLRIGIDNTGRLAYRGADWNPTFYPTAKSTLPVNDGAWHHLVVVQDVATEYIYIDGADVTDPATRGLNTGQENGIQVVGRATAAVPADTAFTGSILDIFVGRGAPTAAQVRTWYQLAKGYLPETSAERATRLLALSGFSDHATITPRPKAQVAAINTAGSTLLAELQRVADSEQGRLFADRYGRVRLDDRYWWQSTTNGRVSQATISDDGSDVPYAMVTSTLSRREVQNDVTVTGSNQTRARITDTSSISTYGRRTGSVSTILASQTAVEAMAEGLVALRKTPVARTGAITVRPQTSPAQWPTVLELDLADRVTFELMPARWVASTSQYTRTLIIERIDWQITATDWSMMVTGSPVPTYTLFRWGISLLGGTDVLGY